MGTDTARVFEFRGDEGELWWWFFGVSQAVGFVRRCVKWDSEEGDLALEGEILEFMKESKNLEAFLSRKELVEAGRMDLVDVIAKKGGWLLLGWDLSKEEDKVEQRKVQENVTAWVSELKLFFVGLRPWVFNYEMDQP
ncbi:protein ptst like protein 2 [Quercus suber]|uniref:Protein ptst like protein 2 n=1 Tax=Quercus suber TaxID=58331 RepID=A0AAW0L5V2_QUESU|nr:hypothetical protein CFP56_48513 [Quercus suber]